MDIPLLSLVGHFLLCDLEEMPQTPQKIQGEMCDKEMGTQCPYTAARAFLLCPGNHYDGDRHRAHCYMMAFHIYSLKREILFKLT